VSQAALLAGLLTLTTLTGCARGTIDIRYPAAAANTALLATVVSQVVVATVTDRRPDTSRIGARPGNGKPIVTSRPVPDIVREALVAELRRNGHNVLAGPGDVAVAADVEEFWLEAVGRADTTQYVGRVAITVVVADGHTGHRLSKHRYVGIKRRIAEADARNAWREIMDAALARTIRDIATDPDLAHSLRRAPERVGGAAPPDT
jgi:uncharacterized lipoprotein YajG